jgi:hypothetical protein
VPKRSIYVSPELDAELKKHPGLPISEIFQGAAMEAIGFDTDPVVEARRLVRRAERLLTQHVDNT